jgi:hypothetical protein
MKTYLPHLTPSEVGKLCLILCLGANIVPRIDVMLCISVVVHLLMAGTPPCRGACPQGVPILNIKSAQKTYIHVAVSFSNVRIGWGKVP